LTAALLLGVAARKLHLPPLVGYLLAGMLIGPHTPGINGDLAVARELSEIGIILLMFGVGLHFSPQELAEARGIAVPGVLGVAFAAYSLFGVSFALGALLSGMVLGQSTLSQKAAEQTLPLCDAFTVLFFVSIGMLFDPGILLRQPFAVVASVLVVVLGKSVTAWAIARARGLSSRQALGLAVLLAQIGEFSFILAGIGVAEGVLPPAGRDLVLATALLTIALNPVVFRLADQIAMQLQQPAMGPPGGHEPGEITAPASSSVSGSAR